jgi:hypothetical protein
MRNNIPRQLEQLEQKIHIHEAPQPVIFVTFVKPKGSFGGQPCQSDRAECDDQMWERKLRETPEDFERRVFENLQRHEHCPTIVIFSPESKTEARPMSEITPLIGHATQTV